MRGTLQSAQGRSATCSGDRGPAEVGVCSSPPTASFLSETLSSPRSYPGIAPPRAGIPLAHRCRRALRCIPLAHRSRRALR
eukprot:1175016-Pyramimonas_sp.AAC.1